MLPLSFLVEIIFMVPLPMSFCVTMESRYFVITLLPC